LQERSVVSILETTAADGREYLTRFYDVDARAQAGDTAPFARHQVGTMLAPSERQEHLCGTYPRRRICSGRQLLQKMQQLSLLDEGAP
jgi:hypothetical protein